MIESDLTYTENVIAGDKVLGSSVPDISFVTRKDFDLTDRKSADDWFYGRYFDVVIHTAIKGGSRLKKDNSDAFYQNIQILL